SPHSLLARSSSLPALVSPCSLSLFFLTRPGPLRDLHSFPTRRSSDLVEPANRADFERRLAAILRWPRVREWGLDDREVLARSRSWPASARSLFVLPLEAYRQRTGKPRLGEKSVLNEFRVDELCAWLRDFRLVQMIRDPVAA